MDLKAEDRSDRRLSTARYSRDSSVWTEGDFEVITSDRVRYLVPSYHLFGSRLFRDAQNFESPPSWPVKYSVTLPDPEFETAAVFDLFLDLITNVPLSGLLMHIRTLSFPDWLCVCGLFKLLHKWEVARPFHKLLRHNIDTELRDPDMALEYFAIGAIADDADICRAVLQHHAANLASFNPAYFPYYMWKACPPTYLGALVRVWADAGGNENYCHKVVSRFNLHLTDFAFSEAQLALRASNSGRGFAGNG
ncbi:uncharacterized protein COLE_01318 [Cutaneotrichosporon oleaginosum]|uniref:uncharacterized protein n=1 Tax=Cutaneotrichosporon oleaginosum TaxID=879819 RepID=UPI001327A5AD|nr:hypothetical protein COLE_01318 [Cutaneotrichosporon oleaginosum]